ncbi:MAG: rhomboid family intramembrane serine protease [Desulfobacca sp.]|nr:rhomboid family intramembrane serine protease [Desulfobacca sp.]
MIPLHDNIPSQRTPYVNYIIIAINCLIFLLEIATGPHLRDLINILGFIPAKFLALWRDSPRDLLSIHLPLFTTMFLHGGWLHLIANMWTLYIFGDNVEDTLGHGRYLLFYLACGLAGSFLYLLTAPYSQIPVIGASGAIAGVMGAYFFLFPRSRVLTLIPFLFIYIVEIPAFIFLGFWFVLQFFSGTLSILSPGAGGGVAWWAHIGGFLCGVFLLYLFLPSRVRWPFRQRF